MNAKVTGQAMRVSGRTDMTRYQVWRIYYLEAKYEFIRTLRNPGFGFPFLIMPVLLFLLFSALGTPESENKDTRFMLFSGMAILGIMGPATFGFGAILAGERQFKLIDFKRALPMPSAAHLTGKFFCAAAYAFMVIISMITIALILDRITLTATQGLMVGLTLLFGVLPFCAIGFFIGARASAHVANGITTIIYLPQLYFSGLFFPMPKAISWIALFMPPFYLNQLSLAAAGAPHTFIGNAFVHIAVLALLTLVLTVSTAKKMAKKG
jgi:ABC-2 type transport system permease protein